MLHSPWLPATIRASPEGHVLRATHAAVVLAALITGGCCQFAHLVCPCTNPRCPATSRETPDALVDLLVDAFRNQRVGDIYDSFHPAFRVENGNFTESEFEVAYGKWEADFAADAETLATAERTVRPQQGGRVLVEVENKGTGAYMPILLENRPQIRVVTKNAFVGTLRGPVDMHALVTLKDGRLSLPPEFDLRSIENVQPETLAKLTSADITSVEFTDYWMVREIDPARCRNIRFLDKIKEYLAK
jgi:hypothetical protein